MCSEKCHKQAAPAMRGPVGAEPAPPSADASPPREEASPAARSSENTRSTSSWSKAPKDGNLRSRHYRCTNLAFFPRSWPETTQEISDFCQSLHLRFSIPKQAQSADSVGSARQTWRHSFCGPETVESGPRLSARSRASGTKTRRDALEGEDGPSATVLRSI